MDMRSYCYCWSCLSVLAQPNNTREQTLCIEDEWMDAASDQRNLDSRPSILFKWFYVHLLLLYRDAQYKVWILGVQATTTYNDLHSAKILCNWSAWTTRRVPSWPPTVALIRYKEIQRYTEIWIIGGLCHWPSKTTTWLLVNHTLCQRDIKTLPVAAINEWMKYSGKRILLSKEDRDLPWWYGNT